MLFDTHSFEFAKSSVKKSVLFDRAREIEESDAERF